MRRVSLIVAAVSLFAASPAWAADSMSAPTALQLNTAFSEAAGAFTVQPGEPNTAAPFTQQCGSGNQVGVARTGWYTVQGSGGPMTVTTDGSDFDSALFVYTGSAAGGLVDCSDDAGGGTNAIVEFASTAGTTYYLQVGRACNAGPPSQCNQAPAAGAVKILAGGTTSSPPASGGTPPPTGGAPTTTPGGAGADGSAKTPAASFPVLRASTASSVVFRGAFTRFTKLNIAGVPAGASVVVSCKAKKGCPFKSKTLAVTSAKTLALGKLFKSAKLRSKSVVAVRVTRAGFIGNVFTFTVRKRKPPLRTTQCLPPGASTPQACS